MGLEFELYCPSSIEEGRTVYLGREVRSMPLPFRSRATSDASRHEVRTRLPVLGDLVEVLGWLLLIGGVLM